MVYKKEQENSKKVSAGDLIIVDEQSDFVVVNKPSGMLVHPTMAKEIESVVAFLLKKYPEIKKVHDQTPAQIINDGSKRSFIPERPGIVHRLDKDASGLLVVARTQKMFDHLKKQFKDKTVEKEYLVLVYGKVEKDHGSIDFLIDRGKEGRMVSRPRVSEVNLKTIKNIQPGKEALTEFWVEKRFVRHTLLRIRIHTGRTHQIRVHMFGYNNPVVGDKLYFNKNLIKQKDQILTRMFLHSTKLCFEDLGGKRVCYEAKLPEDLKAFIGLLK